MKSLSKIILVISFVIGVYSQFMDVTVLTPNGYDRVINFHLLSQQSNYLTISIAGIIIGLIIYFLSKKEDTIYKGYKKLKTDVGYKYKLYYSNDKITNENVKKLIIEQYKKSDDDILTSKNENDFKIQNKQDNSYVEVKVKDNYIYVSFYRKNSLDFINSLYTTEEAIQKDDSQTTNDLIELSKLLDKGLITESEFIEHKKNLDDRRKN